MRLAQLIRDDVQFEGTMDKYTLLTLAHYGNTSGKNIYPGIDLLAKTMLVSERTVKRSIKRLIASGKLKEAGRHGLNKQYEIPMHELWTEKQINPHNKTKPQRNVSRETLTEEIPDTRPPAPSSSIDFPLIEIPADNPEDERIRRLMLAVKRGQEARAWQQETQWKKKVIERGEQAQRELDLLSKEALK